MESIRNFLKSWPGRIFLMFCLSPLVILGLESYFSGGSNANEVVKVGDQSISRDDYQSSLNARRNELLTNGVEPSLINNTVLSQEILQSLINQALLRNEAQKLGMHVSDTVINNLLLEDPQFLDAEGNFSNDRFAFALKQQGLTKDQLFDQYRQQLNIMQLFAAVSGTALYPSNDIDKMITMQQETRNVWLHRVPWRDYVNQVLVSDAQIKGYYDTHQKGLNSLATVHLDYLVLSPDDIPAQTVSDTEIKAAYDTFKSNYAGNYAQQVSQILITGDHAAETIKTVQQRLANGEDFAAIAKEVSQDPVSSKKGGDIGTFNADAFGTDADKVAQALESLKVGEVSQPIKTTYGYQLFKVTKVSGESIPSLADMREKLASSIQRSKKEALIADKITRINDMAIDGLSLDDIAQQEDLRVQTIENYTEEDNTSALNQPAIIKAAFDDFTIQGESVSTSIGVNNSTIWVQPSQYRPVAPLTLTQASADIKQILTEQQAIDLALKEAKRIAATINQSENGIEAVEVPFTSLGAVTRQNLQLTLEEKAAAFGKATKDDKPIATAQSTPQGASVLVVDEVISASAQSITETERKQTADIVRQTRGQEEFSDYLNYLEMATKVEKNDSVIKELSGY